ncbi:MAG: glycerophosphodiester phosphodiesterase family protein [Nanoarchaeota archaeon]|nr:glycerophosphodiester phosphodiesterase family protein [Nanoarchaeota archaeon]
MIKKRKLKVKKLMLYAMLVKIPLLIYLIVTLSTIPAIDAIQYDVILGAHRGDSVEYPENTLDAIKSAVEKQEYQFIEFDIQYTKDMQIVVFHDSNLMRMEGSTDKIIDLTYEELQEKTELEIPLYKDVMDVIRNSKRVNIEIKSAGYLSLDENLVDFVLEDAKERGILKNILISSISGDVVKYVSENYPEIKTGQIFFVVYSTYVNYDFTTRWVYDEVEETGADYIMLYGSNIKNIESLVELKPEGKTICFWYFSDEMYVVQIDDMDCLW